MSAAAAALNALRGLAIRCLPPPQGDPLLAAVDAWRDAWLWQSESEAEAENFIADWAAFSRAADEPAAENLYARLTSAFGTVFSELRQLFRQLHAGDPRAICLFDLGAWLAQVPYPTLAARQLLTPCSVSRECSMDPDWELSWRALWSVCGLGSAPELPAATSRDKSPEEFAAELHLEVLRRLSPAGAELAADLRLPVPMVTDARPTDPHSARPGNPGRGEIADNAPAATAAPLAHSAAMDPIVWHGDQRYSRGGGAPVTVSGTLDRVLRAFLACGGTVEMSAELARLLHYARPERLLRQLQEIEGGLFATAIRTKGSKAAPGYYVAIVPAPAVVPGPAVAAAATGS
jgi:hypothetical protein